MLKIGCFLIELISIPLVPQWANGIACDWPTAEYHPTLRHHRPYGKATLRRRTAVVQTLTFNDVFLLVVAQINDETITTTLIDELIHTAH